MSAGRGETSSTWAAATAHSRRPMPAGTTIVGVDADREALAEAQKLGIETRWADLDDALPFEAGTFDVVVAGELLEHLRDPRRVVSEVLRVLRSGGTFVGSVPNAYRLKNRLRFLTGRKPENDPTHLRCSRPKTFAPSSTASRTSTCI